jgi:poly(A) polymerase
MTVKDGKVHFYNHEYVGADIVEDILRELKYDNDTIKEVQFLIRNHMRTKQMGDGARLIKDKTLNKLLYECKTFERFESLMKVIECDNLAHKKECCIYDQYDELTEKVKNSDTYMKMFGYKLPVTGNDIMETLGIGPGPIIAEINNRLLKKAFLDPGITRERCLQLLPGIKKEAENYLKD